ncbi:MAG: DUF2971 domain-containing protein [Verrucomicrobiota bacterium]|nr:DUF2971 domain-containing protein [Verrucomicrobiota bacterium]
MGDLIYKYCRHYGVQFIEKGKLKFSPPIEFDDPFELRPQPGSPTLTIEDSNILLGDDLRMRDLYNSTKSTTPFDEWLGPRRASPQEFNLELARVLREGIENYCPGALASISKQYGMACFSETASDVRMWSHYANEHKGIVVGLDRGSLGINLLPVRCKSERVHFTASQFANPQLSWVVELLTTKSEDWRYQKEWRAVLRLGEPPLKFDHQLGGHIFEVPREAMKRVLIGCKATTATGAAVEAALSNTGLPIVPERARPHRSAFAMEFAPIDLADQK